MQNILSNKFYDESSVFLPENLLRESRRQKNKQDCNVPEICLLDPDGDLADYLLKKKLSVKNECWAWCVVCQANGPRFMKDIMPMITENKEVKILTNDLSDNKTTTMSKRILEKAGIYDFAEKNPATGMLYFFDANTKKLLSSVSLAQSNEDMEKAYHKALSKR